MRKKISLITIGVLLILLIVMTAAACNRRNEEEEQVYGQGLNVSFLKDFTIDLEGVTSLAIEKRATRNTVKPSNVAYADEVIEKNKLVGETEDKTVIEITLRTKMGEAFSQDELQAEFNKLYVSGNFVYFELRPIDYLESLEEMYGSQAYHYYEAEDLNEDGTPKEGASLQWINIPIREDIPEENLEEFEKSSEPNPITGSFVYSIESDKIYDLSETGYEVIGKDVARIGEDFCRVYINDDGEFETTALFNDYTSSKIGGIRTDRWGNVFGITTDHLNYVDAEARVFVESTQSSSDIEYVIDENGNSVQLNSDDGTVKWITENGELRDPQPGDNLQKKRYNNGYYWEGIIDGEPLYYPQGINVPTPNMAIPYEFNNTLESIRLSATIVIDFVTQKNGAIADENGDFPVDDNAIYAIWYDLSDPNATIGVTEGTVVGLNVITDNFYERYPNPQQNIYTDNPNGFSVSNQDGETKYEFYWDDAEQTVKIRVLEETIAPLKEVKKFQPIGG